MIGFLKGLIVLALAVVVFGGGGYYTYQLYIHPEIQLEEEKHAPTPAVKDPNDPTVLEYEKCLQVESAGDPLAARNAYTDFLDAYPDSTKVEDARNRLGIIQTTLLLSPRATPDKQTYIVKRGDVLNKLSHRLKTSPDLLMEMNQLENSNLRVGQRLFYTAASFSATIDRPASKVIIQRGNEFFCQFPIRATQGNARVGPPKKGTAPVVSAKVQDKPCWKDGQRLGFGEKGFRDASRWIVLQPAGHTLYGESAEKGADGTPPPKPPSGYGLEPDAIRALSALLHKGDTVTIR